MHSIIYVDDDQGLLELNKLYLEQGGDFFVEIHQDAEKALDMIATGNYEAILSDYQMPGMDGIELLKAVRRDFGDIPFLLFTGKGREEIVIEALNNGVDFYIQKGPDLSGMIAELKHKLHRAIDRRKIEEALKKSQQQLIDIINFLPDPTCVIDKEGRVIAWNRAIEVMTGIPRNQMIGRGGYEYAVPFYGEARPILMDYLLSDPTINSPGTGPGFERNGKNLKGEGFFPSLYGGLGAYVSASASILYDSGGNVTGAIQSFRDITDLHRMKHDLGVSREMALGFANLIPVAIYEMDLTGNLTFANTVAYEWFGIRPEDRSRPISIFDYITPGDRQRAAEDIKKAMAGGGGAGQEYLLQRKDHSTFPALIYGGHITEPDTHRTVGLRGVIIDLTHRKRETQALHESEERLKLAVRAGDIGIWDVNLADQTINDLSEWMNRSLGYSIREPFISVYRCIQLVHPLDLPGIFTAFRKHFGGSSPLFEAEFRARCADGTWKWVTVRGKAIELDRNNRPLRITGTVNEIPGRRERAGAR